MSMGVTTVSHIEQDRIDFVRFAIFFFGDHEFGLVCEQNSRCYNPKMWLSVELYVYIYIYIITWSRVLLGKECSML